jgi:hypothetical protein
MTCRSYAGGGGEQWVRGRRLEHLLAADRQPEASDAAGEDVRAVAQVAHGGGDVAGAGVDMPYSTVMASAAPSATLGSPRSLRPSR